MAFWGNINIDFQGGNDNFQEDNDNHDEEDINIYPDAIQVNDGGENSTEMIASYFSSEVNSWICAENSGDYVSNRLPPLSPPSRGFPLQISKEVQRFSYAEIESATKHFDKCYLVGKGLFGDHYTANLPGQGMVMIVKCMGCFEQLDFGYLFQVNHSGLVPLIGYCSHESLLLLIYRFLPHKTLAYHLHGDGPTMEWSDRFHVGVGVARALAYLHDCSFSADKGRLIHGALKAENIILNDICEPKLAHYGLTKLVPVDSHTYMNYMLGYLAPDYAVFEKLASRSDTFSFGVLILELVTGKDPATFSGCHIVDWVSKVLTQLAEGSKFDSTVDPKLENNYNSVELARFVVCATACTRRIVHRRPRMTAVVKFLEGELPASVLDEGFGMRNDQ